MYNAQKISCYTGDLEELGHLEGQKPPIMTNFLALITFDPCIQEGCGMFLPRQNDLLNKHSTKKSHPPPIILSNSMKFAKQPPNWFSKPSGRVISLRKTLKLAPISLSRWDESNDTNIVGLLEFSKNGIFTQFLNIWSTFRHLRGSFNLVEIGETYRSLLVCMDQKLWGQEN